MKTSGNVFDAFHQIIVLRDRHGDAGDVDLLERILAQDGGGNLARDRDQRRAVHPGVGDGRHQIGRARTAGGHADADLAGSAGVPLGGVARTLFVPAQDVMQPVVILPEGVIERHDGAAGNAEDDIDALADQGLAHYLSAGTCIRHD